MRVCLCLIILQVTSEDMEKAMEIFQEIKSKCDDVNKHVSNIIQSVEEGDVQTAKVSRV